MDYFFSLSEVEKIFCYEAMAFEERRRIEEIKVLAAGRGVNLR